MRPSDPWFNIKDAVLDIFAVAHVLGWWGKALVIRDYTLLLMWSFTWEVLEITFQHLLPNLKECWWDHWVFDFSICNMAGMIFGMWICGKYASMKYNWVGLREISTTGAKVGRILKQFYIPYSWTQYRWDLFGSSKRLAQV